MRDIGVAGLDLWPFCRKKCQRTNGVEPIASAESLEDNKTNSAASLLFAPGRRPRAAEIRRLAEKCGQFSISLDTSEEGGQEEGWVELLANGLTFDCTGLAPQMGSELPDLAHSYGLSATFDKTSHQAILIRPGPHLAAGGAMFPVVRTLAMIAAYLAALDGVEAVAWHPARAISDPGYFRNSVLSWMEGGAFPGLGLTALEAEENGGLRSEGLSLFTGQELRMQPEVVSDVAEASKIALRLLNWLVENGRITESFIFTGPSGETLRLEPVDNLAIVNVWRGSH